MKPTDHQLGPSLPRRLGRAVVRLPGRWWLWLGLGLLLMVVHLWSLPLAMRLALMPAAKEKGPGWMVARYDNIFLEGAPKRLSCEPPLARLALEQPNTSLSTYAIVTAPHDGLYELGLVCDDYGALHVDGRLIFGLEPMIAAANQEEKTVELSAGPHLFRVDLFNLVERGKVSLKMRPYGQGELKELDGTALACPHLSNIANWWRLLETAPRLAAPGMALISLGLALWLLPRAARKGGTAFGAACAAVLLPSLLIPGGEPPKAPFNDRGMVAGLAAQRPEVVFIGNSIVESCNDPARMGELLGGRPVANVITYGGFTAFDYMMLKNLVVAAGVKPKTVFLFFRGNLLTKPRERTEGVFNEALQALSHDSEPVLRRVLDGRMAWDETALAWVKDRLRVSARMPETREALSRAALWLTIPPWAVEKAHKRRARLHEEVNDRFELGRLRGRADDRVAREKEQDDADYDFDALVEASFLPHILELCARMGSRPVFVRAQERPTENGPLPDDPRLTRYLARARAYLEARGAGYHDFTGDPELPLSMYAAGDHIAYPGRFSELMLRRMPWAFR